MRNAQLLGEVCERNYTNQTVCRLSKGFAHWAVYTAVDEPRGVYYIVTSRARKKGWPLSRQEDSASPENERLEGRPLFQGSPARRRGSSTLEVQMADEQNDRTSAATVEENSSYTVRKREYTRWWEVRDPAGELVCLTVYRRGAREVVRRLSAGGSNR